MQANLSNSSVILFCIVASRMAIGRKGFVDHRHSSGSIVSSVSLYSFLKSAQMGLIIELIAKLLLQS